LVAGAPGAATVGISSGVPQAQDEAAELRTGRERGIDLAG
jgi:hypothetical protein